MFGVLAGNITLDNDVNDTEYDWDAIDSGIIYFANANATVDFTALLPLGFDTGGSPATTDFFDAEHN